MRGRAVFAVFPFESSTDGLVQPAITALAQTELVMVAERAAPATYLLMSRNGNVGDVDKVYRPRSRTPPASVSWVAELPRVSVIDVRSPVVAAQLAQEDHGSARDRAGAVRSGGGSQWSRARTSATRRICAFRYGVASARPAMRSGNDTTCLLFSVDDSPGALFDVLRHFAERGINLKKLQVAPVQNESWDYVFYVEVGGHVTDRAGGHRARSHQAQHQVPEGARLVPDLA